MVEITNRREGGKNPPEELSRNNGGMARRFKQGRPSSSWSPTGPSNGARERKACGMQPVTETVTQRSVHRSRSQNIFLFSSTARLPNILSTNGSPAESKSLRRSPNKRVDRACRGLPASKHGTASGGVASRIHATPSSFSVSSRHTTAIHSRLTGHQPPGNTSPHPARKGRRSDRANFNL